VAPPSAGNLALGRAVGYPAPVDPNGTAAHLRVLSFPPGDLPGLLARLEALREDPAARVVLLLAGEGVPDPPLVGSDLVRLERFPLPTVFAFEGLLAGDLLAVALACDVRLCDEKARIDASRLPDGYASARLALLAGTGAPPAFTAQEALQHGLASRIAPPGGAAALGRNVAATIASRGPIATRLAKEALSRGLQMPLEQALRFETDLTLLLQTTKDRSEGVRAFLEKRPPVFTGE
jgi:hypothetical protein